jgi:Dullard-like phosphatase family protein
MTFERVRDARTGELRPYDTIVTAQDNPEDWGMVYFRPYLRTFLEAVCKVFEVVLFTAACKEYADQIVNAIDPDNRFFEFRLYRDSCQECTPDPSHPESKIYIKDLRVLGRDLSDVVLIDNSLLCFACQLNNGIVCNPFKGGSEDKELISILDVLSMLNRSPEMDTRRFFRKMYGLSDIIREYSNKGGRTGVRGFHQSALDEFLDTPTQAKREIVVNNDNLISQKSTAMNTPTSRELTGANQQAKDSASEIRTISRHALYFEATDDVDYRVERPPRSAVSTPRIAAPPIFINTILPGLEHTRTPIQTLYNSIVCNQNRSRFA